MDADSKLNSLIEDRGRTPPPELWSNLGELVNEVAREMAKTVAAHSLTYIDFVLLRLFLGVEEWTTTQLAQTLPFASSSISRTVAKLVDSGLVHRRRLLSDRRVVILTLTQEGQALTQDLDRRIQEYEATLCEGVSDEDLAVFTSVASNVLANHAALVQSRIPSPMAPA